jgi:hypothetical protein
MTISPRPLSEQLLRAAETLALMISHGRFKGAGPDAECELRGLSIQLACWSEEAE